MATDLISKKTRREFREAMVSQYVLREIQMEFDAAGIACDVSCPGATATEFSHVEETRTRVVQIPVMRALTSRGMLPGDDAWQPLSIAGLANKVRIAFLRGSTCPDTHR